MSALTTHDRPVTVSHSPDLRVLWPEQTPGFADIWQRCFLEKFDARVCGDHFVVQPKRFAKGLIRLQKLRPLGWNSGWHPPFDDAIVTEFLKLQPSLR